MKKFIASLTLAAFMLGSISAFAYTPNNSANPTVTAKKKSKKKHKRHSTKSATAKPAK